MKKKRKQICPENGAEEEEANQRPKKSCLLNQSKNGRRAEKGAIKLEDEHPWRNLQLILSLQNKDIPILKNVELAFDYVNSESREGLDDCSEALETVNTSRLLVFLCNWIESVLISSEKQLRAEGYIKAHSETGGSCLDHRCWTIFKYCLEESKQLNVSLNFSKDLLRVIHCVIGDALSRLDDVSMNCEEFVMSNEEYGFYIGVLDCISLVFSSHGGVSNENLDLWQLTIHCVLELVHMVLKRKLDNSKGGVILLELSCCVLEPFSKFLRIHPTRKDGFRNFIDKLLEPLIHLLEVLHPCTSGPTWTKHLFMLIEEVLRQGLFHSTHIDGFLNLQSLSKYKSADATKPKDETTIIKSYHRHLFDKLKIIVAKKNASVLAGVSQLLSLFVDSVKKQTKVSVGNKGSSRSSGNFEEISIQNHSSIAVSAEIRKSFFEFFAQIMESLLSQINVCLDTQLEAEHTLSHIYCIVGSTSKLLFSFMYEKIYIRTEDISEGASINFLKLIYNTTMSLSAKVDNFVLASFSSDKIEKNKLPFLITKELILVLHSLLDIEYEVVGDELESLWTVLLSGTACIDSSTRAPGHPLLTVEILNFASKLIDLYSELRQVDTALFALCRATRHSLSSPKGCEFANFLCKLLGSLPFRNCICNAIKSIPEGQASGCIRQVIADVSETMEWTKIMYQLPTGYDLKKAGTSCVDSPCVNHLADILGRGLSELYSLILDSVAVTTGNSNLIGNSIKELMAILRPSLSILVTLQPSRVYEFLFTVTGRTFGKKTKFENDFVSTIWIFVFFFRLYMSCRSLQRQAISLMSPGVSKKTSLAMGDSFAAFSANEWLKRTDWTGEDYFSWIIQPSAPLISVINAISDVYFLDSVVGGSSMVYILSTMAIQRLVDLNGTIKSFSYLLERQDYLIQIKLTEDVELSRNNEIDSCISDLRVEAACLTKFLLGYVSLVDTNHEADNAFYHDSLSHSTPKMDSWDLGIGSLSADSLPVAIWRIICENLDIWCAHATKKDLKKFLLLLIRKSLPCISDSLHEIKNNIGRQHIRGKVTVHDISLELLCNTVLYEQQFVCRLVVSRICKMLQKSVSLTLSNLGEVDLKFPPDWGEALRALEDPSSAILDQYVKDDQLLRKDSAFLSCRNQADASCNGNILLNAEIARCQALLNLLAWMPKRYLSWKSFSLCTTSILNLEWLLVGSLMGWHQVLHLHSWCPMLRLLVSCRRTLKMLIMSSCGKDKKSSARLLACLLSENSFLVLWLLKSLSVVVGLEKEFLGIDAVHVKEMMLSCIDHTSYILLAVSKDELERAITPLIAKKNKSEVNFSSVVGHKETDHIMSDICLESPHNDEESKSMQSMAKVIKEQLQSSLISLRRVIINNYAGVLVLSQELRKLLLVISSFQGFLRGFISALDNMDSGTCKYGIRLLRSEREPLHKIYICIETSADMINNFLHVLFVDDCQLPEDLTRASAISGFQIDQLESPDNIFADKNDLCEKEMQSCISSKCPPSSFKKGHKLLSKKRYRPEDADIKALLTKIEYVQQNLKQSLLLEFVQDENLESAYSLRQLFVASSAVLRLNSHINHTSLSWSLIPVLIAISRYLLLQFANGVDPPQQFSFVCLEGVTKFLQELGAFFPFLDPLLSGSLYSELIHLHLRAIGKCLSLHGKGATLGSKQIQTATEILNSLVDGSELTFSHPAYWFDEFVVGLKKSFTSLVGKASELHLLSAIQAIERAVAGVQENCVTNYEIYTGNSNGGRVSSSVAAGIDCLDLILEFVSGRKSLNAVKGYIQNLVGCLFNVILHLQDLTIFYKNTNHVTDYKYPDSGLVILMCIEVLTAVSRKRTTFQMDACQVGQSLRTPGSLFQDLIRVRISKSPVFIISGSKDPEPFTSQDSNEVDQGFLVKLYDACCQLLCVVLKQYKNETLRCIALLESSVDVLLHCLEMVDIDSTVRRGYFSWEVQEGVKCALCLGRIYEEIKQQKDVFGHCCFQFLSSYIWVYCGNGPLQTGIRREVDEALRPGIYALIDSCSIDDLQHLHTVFGEGPCRNTLASLQRDYKLHFQYEGKV